MKHLFLLVCLLYPTFAIASDATGTMAKVLLSLNHFPSADNKVSLQAVVDSDMSTPNQKALAGAIGRIAHKVNADDTAVMQAIAASGNASEKVIAATILGVNHEASDASRKALDGLMMHSKH